MELRYYQTADDRRPFDEWLANLGDDEARARIQTRLDRAKVGVLGDVESVGSGVLELRVHWGPGYRVYFARVGDVFLLLLCGGDKRTQGKDIKDAKRYFEDYKRRAAKGEGRGRA